MLTRQQALNFLKKHQPNQNIIKHSLALEAIMRALAKRFDPQKIEEWALAGLLHDADYIDSVSEKEQGVKVSQWLKEEGLDVPQSVIDAMAAHNAQATGVHPKNAMEWSIFIADSLTGLIVAAVLVRPDKSLKNLPVEFIMKKFKNKAFASGTRREDIALCEEKLGIPLEQFIKISLSAIQQISEELGL